MEGVFYLTIVLCAMLTTLSQAQPARPGPAPLDTTGKEFVFAFQSNFQNKRPDRLTLLLGANEPGLTRVQVEAPNFNWQQTVQLQHKQVRQVDLNPDIAARGAGPVNGTLIVRATKDISVHGLNSLTMTNDAFLAIPTHGLGEEYFVASYDPVPIEMSQFLITGIQPDTTVKIVLQARLQHNSQWYSKGQTLTVNVGKYQSIQFQSQEDLTGTRITSTKPISVMSGASCTLVPTQVYRCDHLVEHLPPFNTWGKRFTLLPFSNRSGGFIFRIIAGRPSTTVHIMGNNVQLQFEGSFREFNQPASLKTTLQSDKPIMVVQYAKGMQKDNNGDPFMTLIPPVEQYMQKEITFGSFNQSGTDMLNMFAGVSFTSPALFTMSLNGKSSFEPDQGIPGTGISSTFTADSTIPLDNIRNILTNYEKDVRFMAIVYGFASGTSFGYPAAYQLRQITCTRPGRQGPEAEFECPDSHRRPRPTAPVVPVGPGSGGELGTEGCTSKGVVVLAAILPALIVFIIMVIILVFVLYRGGLYKNF
ncbi:IgGFc-binding protein-like isoform X2 [Lytechinus variegatus]|uniref:IgGFc-binding protein-like isoform X2 n=1 Tax=Lytechinus variegatus TaxID=7654 RepID=UPI001BB26E85|nr:IgGFc-binding protein-like isoform X2 [Lytechinus variegatus]